MTQLENKAMDLNQKLTKKERKMGKKSQKDALRGFHLMAAREDKSNQTVLGVRGRGLPSATAGGSAVG